MILDCEIEKNWNKIILFQRYLFFANSNFLRIYLIQIYHNILWATLNSQLEVGSYIIYIYIYANKITLNYSKNLVKLCQIIKNFCNLFIIELLFTIIITIVTVII